MGSFAVLTLQNCYRLARKQAVNITLIYLLRCAIRRVQLVSRLLKSRNIFVLKHETEVVTYVNTSAACRKPATHYINGLYNTLFMTIEISGLPWSLEGVDWWDDGMSGEI